ncbi:MAG TPA: GNAT family N-acetyltransferase [Phycisphaerae bacterium]|nr:GNAT family N-acetyltransferase [Phycisphaerae bacterium]
MSQRQTIKTPRLSLVSASVDMARAAAESDHAALSQHLDAHVPPDWPPPIMTDAQENLVKQLQSATWLAGLAWYLVLRDKHMLVGFVGFKSPPKDGRIDIGYAIVDSQHGKGLATEAVQALSHFAFMDPRVQRIVSETLPELTASKRVLEKCGFTLIAEETTGHGGEEGVVQYELRREFVFGTR